jgi:5-methylcytosine-specific restriction protein A
LGKLKMLRPALQPLKGNLGWLAPKTAAEVSRERDRLVAGRDWYKSARWQRLRWSVLLRDGFACQLCKRVEVHSARLVADHKIPHKGDEALFWDEGNLQCLCKPCHDREKQRQERASR